MAKRRPNERNKKKKPSDRFNEIIALVALFAIYTASLGINLNHVV